MWFSTRSLRKTLNQSSLVSNFDFLGINSPVAYGTNLPKVPVNKLQKYLKPVLRKLGTLQFLSPNGLGFQVQKLIMTNLKVGGKKFPYPYLAFFTRITLALILPWIKFLWNMMKFVKSCISRLLLVSWGRQM